MAILFVTFLIAILILGSWVDPKLVAGQDDHIYMNDDNSSFTL